MENPLFVLSLSVFGRDYLNLLFLSRMRERFQICLNQSQKAEIRHSPAFSYRREHPADFSVRRSSTTISTHLEAAGQLTTSRRSLPNYSPHLSLIRTSSPMGLQDYISANGGIVSLALRFLVRFLQFIFALVVAGLYGFRLDNERNAEQYVSYQWVYAVVVGGLSAITCLVYMLPPIRSYLIFGWDAFLLYVFTHPSHKWIDLS